jgi:hypothetical protein
MVPKVSLLAFRNFDAGCSLACDNSKLNAFSSYRRAQDWLIHLLQERYYASVIPSFTVPE